VAIVEGPEEGHDASEPLHDDPALGIDKHVIAVAIFAGRRVVAIRIALGIDDLVARHALQGYRGAKILAHGVVRGKRESDMTCGGDGGESENNFATDHDFSCFGSSQSFANFSGSARTPQMASRELEIAAARSGSPSCSRLSTLISNRSYLWRKSLRGIAAFLL
jgi:hypothetical protein